MLNTSTLRPGLLVSLSVRISGNISYDRKVIDKERITKDGRSLEKWETERTIADKEEHELALETRGKAGGLIRGLCSQSAFGLLCPESQAGELEAAIRDARVIAEEFNSKARLTRVSVYCLTGRIAADDVEAVKAINSEIRALLEDMQAGVKNLDVQQIRTAAQKAVGLGQMLSSDAAARIEIAVDVARKAARQMVKAGEQAAMEVDNAAIQKIAMQRVGFLDLDDQGREIQAPKAAGRGVELDAYTPSEFERQEWKKLEKATRPRTREVE